MRAAWWWIDRWRQSTAYTDMTAEEQGLYRNLCDEIWVREDHIIPDDDRILGRVSGDPEAWSRCSEKVLSWMKKVPGGWTQVTALEVIAQSTRRAENQRRYRDRKDNAYNNGANNRPDNKPDSPSPSLDLSPEDGRNGNGALHPADRTEKALRQSTDLLRTRLYALIDTMVREDPEKRDPTELMRLVTEYTNAKGHSVRGIVNAGGLSHERLEKSCEDAEAHLAAWRNHGKA